MCLSACVSVCLSASTSLELLDRSTRNFVCRSPVAVAQSFCGGIALCYVLPVLFMTSRLAAVDRMSVHGVSVAKYSAPRGVANLAIPQQSLMSMNALLL